MLPVTTPRFSKSALPANYTDITVGPRFDPGPDPDTGSLHEYWGILARRKGTLLLIALVGALIGFGITIPQTPIYQVRTSLEIVGLNQNFMNVKESSPVNEGGTVSDAVDLQTQVKILQSDSLLDRVLEKMRAAKFPEPSVQIESWRKIVNLTPAYPGAAEAIAYARKNLRVRSLGQTRIIEVTVESPSPEIASAFANTLTNEFIDQNIEARWKTSERTGQWLTRQLEDMRTRLQRSEDRLHAYAREAGLIFTDQKTNVSEERLRQMQEALSTAQTDRISKESRADIAASSPPEALPDVLNDPTLRDYQSKITELNREFAELRTTYTPEHPKVRRVQVQLQTMQAALERERGNILNRIKNDFVESQKRERMIAANYAAQRVVVTGENDRTIQYNILKQEADSNRQLYDAMLQQLKQSTLASALRASNIRVVDPAKAPARPFKPDPPLTAGIGLLSGMFLGAAFLISRERSNRSIQGPGETPILLNLPELGIVPVDEGGLLLRLSSTPRRLAEPAVHRDNQSRMSIVRRPVELAAWHRKASPLAESFRATLVSILFSGPDGKQPKLLVVTSGSPSEGKSTTVSNLGIAMAEVNQRVLLIDADMRRPRLHHIFKMKNDRGMTDLLASSESSLPALLEEGFIKDSGFPNLHVITSGPTTSSATSLLYSSRTSDLLQQFRDHYDIVLIDTPPMLQIPDARVLGRMVDGVILVLRAGQTTRDAATAAHQRFSEDGTAILGTILNHWNPKQSPNGYYGYSGSYYRNYKSYYAARE